MLDIKFIRENRDLVAMGARKKHLNFDVPALLAMDDRRRALMLSLETKRAEQNKVGKTIAETQGLEKSALLESMKLIKQAMQKEEEELKTVLAEWQRLMLSVPNIPDISVPEGASDKENVEIRVWGDAPQFDFTPKDHIALLEALSGADFEKGAAVAGFRGYFLKGIGARLHFALWQFVVDHFVKKGFELMMVPSLVRREALLGTGYLPQGEDDLYKTQDGEYLAGTGEVATMSYYADGVLEKKDLPKKILAFSPCFRREAGSHSKDTKGLIRVHEFFKFEQVVLSEASHEQSVALHEELTANAEELLQALAIPYHVVVNCGGDLGLGQVKKYDIEAWVPSQNAYRETHSSSYFHDFQTRRLNIRYKDDDGKLKFAHSLNNTALAFPRILVPLIENYQLADGSIKVPEALKPYLGVDILK
jgi:seryl-tRNA synthetase